MNYKNGKIYAIRSNQTDDVYIGSTCTPLHKRLYGHRSQYKRWKNGTNKNYMTSYKILEYDDSFIELLEEYPCENKIQLNKKEGEVIRNTPNCVNRFIAGRTKKEWEEDNKDKMSKYREENKNKINEKIDCVCGGRYTHTNKSQHLKTRRHQLYLEKQQHLDASCNLISNPSSEC